MTDKIRVYRLNKPLDVDGRDQTVILTDETNSVIQNGKVLENIELTPWGVREDGRPHVKHSLTNEEIIPIGTTLTTQSLPPKGGTFLASPDKNAPVVRTYSEITQEQYAAFKEDTDSRVPVFQEQKQVILDKYQIQLDEIEKQKAKLLAQRKKEVSKLDEPTLEKAVEAELF